MSEEQDFYSITSTIFIKQNEYNLKAKKRIDEICENDQSIATLIELVYNHYDKGSEKYYMAEGMLGILNELNIEPYGYGWNEGTNNSLGVILNFIKKYIKFESYTLNELVGVKIIITNNKFDDNNIHVSTAIFSNEKEMYECGYTNRAEDYLVYLHDYATMCMNKEILDDF